MKRGPLSTPTASVMRRPPSTASFWGEFCDWYLELVKPTLYSDDEAAKQHTRRTLITILDHLTRLLHPFMPFLCEEIWQSLPMQRVADTIMIAPYPRSNDAWRNEHAETRITQLVLAVTAVRNVRSELGIPPSTALAVRVATEGATDAVRELEGFLQVLGRVSAVEILDDAERPSGEPSVVVAGFGELFVPLRGSVDADAIRERLERELGKVKKDLQGVETKLGRASFIERAPAEIVEKERRRGGELTERRGTLERHLVTLRGQ